MSQRRVFTEEFKRDAVRMAGERGNMTQTARDLGISLSILQRWKKLLVTTQENPFPGHGHARDAEVAELNRELARVREENDILKKAVGILE